MSVVRYFVARGRMKKASMVVECHTCHRYQCWTEGRSSTAVAEDLRPAATATVAEV